MGKSNVCNRRMNSPFRGQLQLIHKLSRSFSQENIDLFSLYASIAAAETHLDAQTCMSSDQLAIGSLSPSRLKTYIHHKRCY